MTLLYEADVLDDEREEFTAYVRCEDCDDSAPAIDMHTLGDGVYLCTPCQRERWIEEESWQQSHRY